MLLLVRLCRSLWARVIRLTRRVSRWSSRSLSIGWAWSLNRLRLQEHRGPGWLSFEVNSAVVRARRRTPLPGPSMRSRLAAPSYLTLVVLALLFAGLVAF